MVERLWLRGPWRSSAASLKCQRKLKMEQPAGLWEWRAQQDIGGWITLPPTCTSHSTANSAGPASFGPVQRGSCDSAVLDIFLADWLRACGACRPTPLRLCARSGSRTA